MLYRIEGFRPNTNDEVFQLVVELYASMIDAQGLNLECCTLCGNVQRRVGNGPPGPGMIFSVARAGCPQCLALTTPLVDKINTLQANYAHLEAACNTFMAKATEDLRVQTILTLREESEALRLELVRTQKELLETKRYISGELIEMQSYTATLKNLLEKANGIQSTGAVGPQGSGAGGAVSPDGGGPDREEGAGDEPRAS